MRLPRHPAIDGLGAVLFGAVFLITLELIGAGIGQLTSAAEAAQFSQAPRLTVTSWIPYPRFDAHPVAGTNLVLVITDLDSPLARRQLSAVAIKPARDEYASPTLRIWISGNDHPIDLLAGHGAYLDDVHHIHL